MLSHFQRPIESIHSIIRAYSVCKLRRNHKNLTVILAWNNSVRSMLGLKVNILVVHAQVCPYMCTLLSMNNFLVIQVTSVLRKACGLNTKLCARELGCLQLCCTHGGSQPLRKGSHCALTSPV